MAELSNVSLFLSVPVLYEKPFNNAYYNSDNGGKNYGDDNHDYNDGKDDYDKRDPRPSRVNPESLDESAAFLDTLRKGGIKHYGLLTVLTFQSDYNFTVSNLREIIAFLKAITEFGDLREVTAWLLYNVYNWGPSNSGPEPPFTHLKHFREAVKGVENATYH
ncbi:hypothetical protein HPB51_013453 [Rhipicephalus microplus]|uniref:Uncharacterized protein n=1 Tax=Rhipicephalus microplus TaxID=6941 RepID=A0A9J6EAR7_RHIMP|nr:hypothetical protein HPB51_013453 [Rhipicephalus microplus]